MASLDTNTWSLIIFILNALSLISLTMIFGKVRLVLILTNLVLWAASQIAFIIYGYYTGQVGFVLLGIFNFIVSLIAVIVKFGQEEDEDDN